MKALNLASQKKLTATPPLTPALNAWTNCAENQTQGACPLAEILDLIAHKWTVQIIHALHRKEVARFLEIQRLVTPITQKELTKRLRQLEEAGLLSRQVYPEIPPRVEYRLTELGLSLVPPLAVLTEWAQQYLNLKNQRHEACL
jgi:DNA-binding HxlR family transcriptional regulator